MAWVQQRPPEVARVGVREASIFEASDEEEAGGREGGSTVLIIATAISKQQFTISSSTHLVSPDSHPSPQTLHDPDSSLALSILCIRKLCLLPLARSSRLDLLVKHTVDPFSRSSEVRVRPRADPGWDGRA
jgi:hypothetical protein